LEYALIKLGSWIHGFAEATRATLVGFSGENLGFMPDIASYDGFVSLFFVFVFTILNIYKCAGDRLQGWTLTTAMKLFNFPY
jgi:hypothetical protein